jgi:hypothetical protein
LFLLHFFDFWHSFPPTFSRMLAFQDHDSVIVPVAFAPISTSLSPSTALETALLTPMADHHTSPVK